MRKRIALSTTQMIMLSFLLAILVGSFLLVLPFASADGTSVSYMDALFTATTSVCVTGLVTVTTATAWSFFGQLVILVLIQIGGLGIITILSGFMIGLHKRIGLGDRMLLQDAFNLSSLSGIVLFIKKVLIGTFIVEGVGALLYMTVFVPEYGVRGIWISIFNAISAFCNAGMDVIGEDSLCGYVQHPMINLVTCLLIVLGGIGYIVWWDVLRVGKNFKKQKFKCFANLTLHSKIALSATGILLLTGAVLFFLFENNNPQTIGNLSLSGKLQAAMFQSVTTRTAGFATVPQQNLTDASAIVSLFFMFIGGSPVGTAGGVKTVTIAVLLISAFAVIRNSEETVLFRRRISKQAVGKAVAVVSMSFVIAFVSTVLLAAVSGAPALDVMYETFSATATVGLSRNLTGSLNLLGKLIIIVTMYLGRVGPISLVIAFNTKKKKQNIIKNPTEEISVG
ncbi:MAG: potassium transporter KtrB [Lachnospiraceae bacterium]|nr:potassium transporter KtrB [Lachnospiraceae bacterium]